MTDIANDGDGVNTSECFLVEDALDFLTTDEYHQWIREDCLLDDNGSAIIPPERGGLSESGLRSAADTREVAYDWAWKGWLCRGKFHVLGGKPGIGKSTVLYSLAAIQSSGGSWPDGSRARAGDVLIWSGEDGWADTIVPRLRASGADLGRCFSLNELQIVDPGVMGNGEDLVRKFHIAQDIRQLIDLLQSKDHYQQVSMLIIDPLADIFVGSGQGASHNNVEVRLLLQRLIDLADERGIAVIGVIHVTKGTDGQDPLERLAGSGAFGAAPRMVWYMTRGTEEHAACFVRLKTNIWKDGDAYTFTLEQLPSASGAVPTQRVVWGDLIEGYARDIIEEAEPKPAKRERGRPDTIAAEIGQWLRGLLFDNPEGLPGQDIIFAGEDRGYSERTIRRVRAGMLDVETVMDGRPHTGRPKPRWRLKPADGLLATTK